MDPRLAPPAGCCPFPGEDGAKDPRRDELLERGEVRALIRAVADPKIRAIVILLYYTGLGLEEILRLRVRDLDRERRIIHVSAGEGRRSRVVILDRVVVVALRAYQVHGGPFDLLFPGAIRGRLLEEGSIRQAMERAAQGAGIRKRVTHQGLRRALAAHLLDTGTDPRYVRRLF